MKYLLILGLMFGLVSCASQKCFKEGKEVQCKTSTGPKCPRYEQF